ncbi:VWA domain-containing protein [Granulicella cerasi]|uniref:VWA domain-containing protein n=1 Tax=Granulicella cerasi TaxID=741063 RepID=A0ABW1ZAI0_9BACT|nr:VWA domain-containing protein [Granulicella cerasi]
MSSTKYARLVLGAVVPFFSLLSVAHAQTPALPPASTNEQQKQPTPPSEGQQPVAQNNGDDTYVIKGAGAREVDLFFTVTNHKGQFATGLQQQSFGLLDDGRPPEGVIKFQQQTNLPLRIGLMIDTSSSIRQRFEFEQQAANDFLLQILHPEDRAFVMGFDVQTNMTQDYTNRVDLLGTGIRKLRPGGGTSLFDALYKTCRDQMATLVQNNTFRKAIVMVSDGDDDYSRVYENEAIRMCQRAQTTIYAISTNTGPSRDKGDEVLQRIADATGGQAFYPTKVTDIATGFQNIEVELRSQYSLIYRPANFKQDGSFRTIYLQIADPRYAGYQVRAPKGYFAPKAEQ